MANNGEHYDPRAQAMEEVHFDWRVHCVLHGGPVPPSPVTTASPWD